MVDLNTLITPFHAALSEESLVKTVLRKGWQIMRKTLAIGVLVILIGGTATAQTVRSGSVEMTMEEVEALRGVTSAADTPETPNINLILNPGFEAGTLDPWTSDGWVLSTTSPNTGTYHAEAEGNIFIRQDFAPVDVTTVTAVSVYMLQPEAAISQICLFYEPADEECDIFLPQATWTQIDLSSLLRVSGNLTGIRVYGYFGGPTGPDITYLDDALIDSTIPVELQSFTVN
jgi:hypothetical protein